LEVSVKVFSKVLLAIGLILLAVAGIMYAFSTIFVSRAELVNGSVTAINPYYNPDYNSTTYCPLVIFTTKTGQKLTLDSEVCSSPADYKVGDELQVYYDPQNPANAQIKNFWSQNLQAVSIGALGLPFFALGGLLLIGTLRKQPSTPA
jgi:hypothetical protein